MTSADNNTVYAQIYRLRNQTQKITPTRILVTGSLKVGKTTLLDEMANDPNTFVVREVAQDLIDKYGYKITQKSEFQDMVFAEQLRREEEATKVGRKFVLCDRGTPDIVAIAGTIGHEIKPEWVQSMFGRYDGVAVFNKDDINFDPSLYDYQVDFDMTEYRTNVDKDIRRILSLLDLPKIEIKGTHQERSETFREYLQQFSLKEGNSCGTEGQSLQYSHGSTKER